MVLQDSKEFILLSYSQRLELSSRWHCLYTVFEHIRDFILPSTVFEVHHQFWRKGVATLPYEEAETSISIVISTTVLHLDIFCYALNTAGTSIATGQESSTCCILTILRWEKEINLNYYHAGCSTYLAPRHTVSQQSHCQPALFSRLLSRRIGTLQNSW